MSYKLRYTGEWKDLKNNINKLFIYKDTNDNITPEEIKIVSFSIDYPSIEYFKDESLLGCGANISLISENRLKFITELYTIKKQELKLIHTINDVVNFVGWVDTEQYEDEFSNIINYPISISANNGFAVLERIPLLNNNNFRFIGIHSAFDIITYCLFKLNHNYDKLYIGLSSTIPELTLGYGENILNSIYLKSENWYDEKEIPSNLREVVNNILVPFTAKMYIHNNSIYIVDNETLNNNNLALRRYNYSNLAFEQDVNISNFSTINTLLGNYSLTVKSGVKDVSVKFNKYNLSNPFNFSINEKTVTDFYGSNNRTIGGTLFVEDIYEGCKNYHRSDFKTYWINLKDTTAQKPNDMFVRCYGGCETISNLISSGYPAFQIIPKISVLSSKNWIRLTGDIMVEDVGDLSKEFKKSNYNSVLLDIKFKVGNYAYYNGGWVYNHSFVNPPPERFICYTGEVMDSGFKINRWYTLNNAATTYIPGSSGNQKWFDGITIPLNSDLTSSWSSTDGGFLIIEVGIRKTMFNETNKYTIRLKNLALNILERDIYGNFNLVENVDLETQGSINEEYLEDLEVDTKQGSDYSDLGRGGMLIKKSGLYDDSDFATNLRYMNIKSVTRANNTATLEELLLNTYLSNLKESRYLFSVKVPDYYPIFRNFEFDLLKRNNTNVKMIPVSMNVDYLNCETSLKLLEYVKDE